MPVRKSRAKRNMKSPLSRRFRLVRSARRKISNVPSSRFASVAEAVPIDCTPTMSARRNVIETMPRAIGRMDGMMDIGSCILMLFPAIEGRAQLFRDHRRRSAGRQQEEEWAIAVDEVYEARMRDGVVIPLLGLDQIGRAHV